MWLLRAKLLQQIEAIRPTSKPQWKLLFYCSYSDTPQKSSKLAPLQERRMIDRFKIYAKGGDGGGGCSSYHRGRHDRRGRPDGGNGGRGGDVILECSPAVWDFSGLQHHLIAKRGGPGSSKNKIGTRGADKIVHVPVGTVIHLVEGEIPSLIKNQFSVDVDPWEIPGTLVTGAPDSTKQSTYNDPSRKEDTACSSFHSERSVEKFARNKIEAGLSNNQTFYATMPKVDAKKVEEQQDIQYSVAELTEPGQQVIVASGGQGGLGNTSMASIPRKPLSEKLSGHKEHVSDLEYADGCLSSVSVGASGSEAVLVLELKSIADVSLVGIPNAGKSTLLGAISRAKPTIGHYAFTTLRPNLGKLNYDDFSITVADVPGLIKGAHDNRGLGHAFLRHIERTKVMAYVVDLSATLNGNKGVPPWDQLKDLILELEYHQKGLSDRPSLIVANKIDEEGAEEMYEELKRRVKGVPIFPVCAVLEEGIPELKNGLRMLVNGESSCRIRLDQNFESSDKIEHASS